jgi:NAD(P)-dependent dehydrogenase (short-subunit alcohol dehydrogenase family)
VKVIVVGATGSLGKAVCQVLRVNHEVVAVGKSRGDYQLDIVKPDAIEAFFKEVGPFDALIVTAGKVHFAPIEEMSFEKYEIGLHDKLQGQVNLVLIGQKYINPKGSFTLTSGILAHTPLRTASCAMLVNRALEGFVQSAAFELAGTCRVNIVSPTILEESCEKYGALFKGFTPISGIKAAEGYRRSVEGTETGQIYEIF